MNSAIANLVMNTSLRKCFILITAIPTSLYLQLLLPDAYLCTRLLASFATSGSTASAPRSYSSSTRSSSTSHACSRANNVVMTS